MKRIYVCTTCGSAKVFSDAYVGINDPSDVRTFDNTYCENCEDSDASTTEVEVSDSFDITKDIYK